jgi:N-acetyl sugar amidotransferase
MRFCTKCVEPDSRPGHIFDEEGVCLPCRVAERRESVDWGARAAELQQVIAWGRERKRSAYDCLIGVSGGKDSTRQALYARDLGLKPLLLSCTYPPEQVTERGAKNLSNLARLGFDIITVSPGPKKWQRLMRRSFLQFGNWAKSTELALFASIPRVAIAYQVPLVFLGENPALAWGTAVGSFDSDAINHHKYSNTIDGGNLKGLVDDDITERQLFWWKYPADGEMERANLRMVYLGYFMKDFNDYDNSRIAIEHGLEVREGADADPAATGSLNTFDALDDDFVHLNQMLKYVKFGFGKASHQASAAIRYGKLTRREAVELVRKYDGRCDRRFILQFCQMIEITEEQFWETVERFRNPDIWTKRQDGTWELRVPLT